MMKERRIVCYQNEFVVVQEEKIIFRINIEEEILKQKIDEVLSLGVVSMEPLLIFKKAVEDITQIKLFGPQNKPKIEGKIMSIHGQEIYKKWRDYILNTELMQRKAEYLRIGRANKQKEDNIQRLFNYTYTNSYFKN